MLAGPRGDDGEALSTAGLIAAMEGPPDWTKLEERNTTLVCVMTDAALDKAACARVARMASGGVARAVDPVHSDVDGDVAFCLSSGSGATDRFAPIAIGTIAATVTAAAIRDSVRPSGLTGKLSPMPGTFKTEAVVLRSDPLRRGRSHAAPVQRHPRAGGGDRQGVATAAVAFRGPAGAVLPARPRPPRGTGRAGHGDLGASTVAAHPGLRSSGPALMAAARGCDAVLRLLDSAEANAPAYNLLCRYLALLDGESPPAATAQAMERPGSAPRSPFASSSPWPPGSPRSSPPARAAARRRAGGLLGRRRRGGLRGLRAGRVRALR